MSTSLIFDDTSPNFQFSSNWEHSPPGPGSGYYNNSVSSPNATANITFYFQGTSAAFFGWQPANNALISIDNSPLVIDVPLSSICAETYCNWYTTPELPQGAHNVSISNMTDESAVDYAIVTTSLNLNGTDVDAVIDGNDTSFLYDGTWSLTQPSYTSRMQMAGTAGSAFVLNFTGKHPLFAGLLDDGASLVVNYTIDGGITQPRNYSTLGRRVGSDTRYSADYLLFSDSVTQSPTDNVHQLKTTIVECELSQLGVNYAVDHNPVQFASSSSSSSFTPTPNSLTPTSTSLTPTPTSLPLTGSTKAVSSGTIVAIVLGVTFILLAVATLFFRRRRARNKARSLARLDLSAATNMTEYHTDDRRVDPFVLHGTPVPKVTRPATPPVYAERHIQPFTLHDKSLLGPREPPQTEEERNIEVARLEEQLEQATSASASSRASSFVGRLAQEPEESALVVELRRQIHELRALAFPPDYEEDGEL